jgi:hypothetical protein
MTHTTDVFISYSSHDQKLADALCSYLEQKNVRCFVASRNITSGKNYPEEIMKGINSCHTVVVVLTGRSNESANVRNEVERAFNLKKTLILFRTENIGLSAGLEYFFASFHWLEGSDGPAEMYFERLYCAIKDLPQPALPASYVTQKKSIHYFLLAYFFISAAAILFWCLPLYKDYTAMKEKYIPVSVKDYNGSTLLDDINRSGLIGIDNRAIHPAPPNYLFREAKKEIFIAGITNKFALQNCKLTLDSALKRGVKIDLLFLNPHSRDTDVVNKINKRGESFVIEFMGLREIVRNDTDFFHHPNVRMRFIDNVPPFVGVMIDVDINEPEKPVDKGAKVRVAPYFKSPRHNDWIFQFAPVDSSQNACTDFVQEFAHMWKSQSSPHPEYFR